LFDFSILKECLKPRLMISGSNDQHIDAEELRSICRDLPGPAECEILEDADHFWWGCEKEMAEKVADFFKRWL
jgi:uncharacterized protein